MKVTTIRLAVFFVSQMLCLGMSHGADDRAKFTDEFSKQERIYRSEDDSLLESYVVDRSLANYTHALPSDFGRTLAKLGPSDRWLDIGAGMGLAILDYYNPNYDLRQPEGGKRRNTKARAVAISIEDRRKFIWQQKAASLDANQIQYLFNKRLRDYTLEDLGQFQLITDVYGGFSYTDNLSRFMEKVLGFLALEGTFYTLLQDVHAEDGANQPFSQDSPFLTEIVKSDGSEVRACSWLKSITCAKVTCEFKQWKPSIEVYRIRKVCNDVVVPHLEPMNYVAGMPPARQFRLKSRIAR